MSVIPTVNVSASGPHPSKDYLFHATRKLRPIGAGVRADGAATTTVRCFDVHYGSRGAGNFARACPEGTDPQRVTVRRSIPTEVILPSISVSNFFRNLVSSFL